MLDFQGVEALLHWPHGAVGSKGSAYWHFSLPSYSMALPLKKKKKPPRICYHIFGPVILSIASPPSQSCNGVTESKTLHGVSFQVDGLAWSTAVCRGASIPCRSYKKELGVRSTQDFLIWDLTHLI